MNNYRRVRVGTISFVKLVEGVPALMSFAYGNDFSFGITFFYNVMSVNYFVVLCRLMEGVVGMARLNYLHVFVLIVMIALL